MKFTNVKETSKEVDDTVMTDVDDSFYHGIKFRDFTEDKKAAAAPLIIATYGEAGVGKSRLLGSAPGDIGIIALEYKSLPSIISAAKEFGKRVILPCDDNGEPFNLVRNSRAAILAQLPPQCVTADNYKYSKQEDNEKAAAREMARISKGIRFYDPIPSCCSMHFYRHHFSREKACGLMLANQPNVKTIGIDTFGQFVDDAMFACYGRNDQVIPLERRVCNQELKDFLNCISIKHVILTHHSTTVWYEGKPTSKTKPANGFNRISHYITVMAKMERDKKASVESGGGRYVLKIEDCLARPEIIGDELTDSDITFLSLATKVYPDVDIDVWE